jgi:hypothetical protein
MMSRYSSGQHQADVQPSRKAPRPDEGIEELHIFDFDGTLFRSPKPNPASAPSDPTYTDRVIGSEFQGGLGWFQSQLSLSPPAVPQNPTAEWFIPSIVARFNKARGTVGAHLVVMTGRELFFERRIHEILGSAKLQPDQVILKPHIRAGTVNYKLDYIRQWIVELLPKKIFLYEDRMEHAERFDNTIRGYQQQIATRGTSTATAAPVQAERTSSTNSEGFGAPRRSNELDLQALPEWYTGFQFELIMPTAEDGPNEVFLEPRVESDLVRKLQQRQSQTSANAAPRCDCGRPAKLCTARASGNNFWGCSTRECNFYRKIMAPR